VQPGWVPAAWSVLDPEPVKVELDASALGPQLVVEEEGRVEELFVDARGGDAMARDDPEERGGLVVRPGEVVVQDGAQYWLSGDDPFAAAVGSVGSQREPAERRDGGREPGPRLPWNASGRSAGFSWSIQPSRRPVPTIARSQRSQSSSKSSSWSGYPVRVAHPVDAKLHQGASDGDEVAALRVLADPDQSRVGLRIGPAAQQVAGPYSDPGTSRPVDLIVGPGCVGWRGGLVQSDGQQGAGGGVGGQAGAQRLQQLEDGVAGAVALS